jgi:hypothetical protein
MAVLLLAQGDPAAKDLLRNAIEVRYGLRPPAFDHVKIEFNGKVKAKLGPIYTWFPLEATGYFRFPDVMQWEFIAKPLRFPIHQGVETYNGVTYELAHGDKNTVYKDGVAFASARKQLWAISALLLTPLSDINVRLESIGEYSFRAINTEYNEYVDVYLRPNGTVEKVFISECYNTDHEKLQTCTFELSEEQLLLNDLSIPSQISVAWDDELNHVLTPTVMDTNPVTYEQLFPRTI